MSCCNGYKILDARGGVTVCEKCGKNEQHLIDTVNNGFIEKHFEYIQNICANNHLTNSIETEAEHLFFKNRKGSRKNGETFAAYCIYIACKNQNVGRSLIEVARMCYVPLSLLSSFHVDSNEELKPSNLVVRICAKLSITAFPLVKNIENISDKLYTGLLNSGPPNSAVAVAIVVATKNVGLAKIAWACDISSSCLRRICKIYKLELKELQSLSSPLSKAAQKEFYSNV